MATPTVPAPIPPTLVDLLTTTVPAPGEREIFEITPDRVRARG